MHLGWKTEPSSPVRTHQRQKTQRDRNNQHTDESEDQSNVALEAGCAWWNTNYISVASCLTLRVGRSWDRISCHPFAKTEWTVWYFHGLNSSFTESSNFNASVAQPTTDSILLPVSSSQRHTLPSGTPKCLWKLSKRSSGLFWYWWASLSDHVKDISSILLFAYHFRYSAIENSCCAHSSKSGKCRARSCLDRLGLFHCTIFVPLYSWLSVFAGHVSTPLVSSEKPAGSDCAGLLSPDNTWGLGFHRSETNMFERNMRHNTTHDTLQELWPQYKWQLPTLPTSRCGSPVPQLVHDVLWSQRLPTVQQWSGVRVVQWMTSSKAMQSYCC